MSVSERTSTAPKRRRRLATDCCGSRGRRGGRAGQDGPGCGEEIDGMYASGPWAERKNSGDGEGPEIGWPGEVVRARGQGARVGRFALEVIIVGTAYEEMEMRLCTGGSRGRRNSNGCARSPICRPARTCCQRPLCSLPRHAARRAVPKGGRAPACKAFARDARASKFTHARVLVERCCEWNQPAFTYQAFFAHV